MRKRIWRQSAVFVVAAGIPWGFVVGQENLPGFDQQVRERVLEILPEHRKEDWSRQVTDPSCHCFAVMLNEELKVGQPVYVLVLVRDEDQGRTKDRFLSIPLLENLRLVNGVGALVPVTQRWRRYSRGPNGFDPTCFEPRKCKWPAVSERDQPSLAGLRVWAFELGELFDLSCTGSYHLQFVPTLSSPDVPLDPDLRLSFRIIELQEE